MEPPSCGESERDRRTGCGRSAPALVRRLATSMVPPEPLLSGIKPPMSRQAWLRFLLTHIPILHWTWTYKLQYFIPDIMAGLTVGVMHIPQGLAYGLLTGLDPVYGLYTSFVPVIVYSILGTSRQLSTGTFAVICLMVGNSINQVFSDKGLDLCREEDSSQLLINGTNTTCGEMEVEVAVSLALTSGIIMDLFQPDSHQSPFPMDIMVVTITNAFVIAIVTCAINTSLVQLYSKKHGYPTNSNQEFIAYGVGNIVGAFFSSFSSVASLARTAVQNDAGGKTQLVGLISSVVVGVVLVSLSSLFYSLPKAVLAAIICGSMFGMLKQVTDMKKYFRVSYSDTLVWLVVFFAAVFLGMDLGLALGILFSLLILVFRAALCVIYEIEGNSITSLYMHMDICCTEGIDKSPCSIKPSSVHGQAPLTIGMTKKDVSVFWFYAPLCFVNIGVFRTRLMMAAHLDKDSSKDDGGCVQTLVHRLVHLHPYGGLHKLVEGSPNNLPGHEEENGQVSTIIIDCAPIGYLDTVGTQTLLQVITDFDLKGIQVILASLSSQNLKILQRSNFFRQCGNDWIFPTVNDAVQHSVSGKWLRPHSRQASAKLNVVEMEKLPERRIDENCTTQPDVAVNANIEGGVDNQAADDTDVSQFATHSLSCKKSVGGHHCHSAVNDIIHRALVAAHVPSHLEPSGLHHSDGKLPDGVLIVPWKCGQLLVWDASCPDIFAPSYSSIAAQLVGAVAQQAEDKKIQKYKHLDSCHFFTPVAIKTTGECLDQGQLIFLKSWAIG
ncbi:hypothetical protein EMCRGX_G026449 [Ephydatia muelleri]